MLGWQGGRGDPASRVIELTREDQARLSANFAAVMGRPPTDAELDGVITNWVREEVLYREALRLGLDDGDAVIRKRLAQKMDTIAASAADAERPDDATLRAWLRAHPERFVEDMRVTFDQLYFTTRGRAVVARTLLKGGADWTRVGDAVSLPASFNGSARSVVASELGDDFANEVARRPVGPEWQGPVESALGWHLVRIAKREPGTLPALEAIRERVEGDWRAATARTRSDAAYKVLRDAYTVKVAE